MRAIRHILISLLLWFTIVSTVAAQYETLNGEDFPPPPEDFIYDPTQLMRLYEEELNSMRERTRILSEEYGFTVYVAIFDALSDEPLHEISQKLHERWIGSIPGREGIVIVFLYKTSQIEVGRDYWHNGDAITDHESKRYSDADISNLVQGSTAKVTKLFEKLEDRKLLKQEYLPLVISLFHETFVSELIEKKGNPDEGFPKTILILLAIIGVATPFILGFLQKLKSGRSKDLITYHFPNIQTKRRFGANYGGVRSATSSFTPQSKSNQ